MSASQFHDLWLSDLDNDGELELVTGNGFPDIVAPGKDGLYLFENLGPKGQSSHGEA